MSPTKRIGLSRACGPCFAVWAATLGLWCCGASSLFGQPRDPFREARNRMVAEAIEREGVSSLRVLTAMRTVPRHEFVPANLRAQAYQDAALPIGHKQTISPPFVVAYMTESIDPQPTDRILEIGTGSGYQAAVLSLLCKEVYSIEIVEPLAKSAKQRLQQLKYDNVETKAGDGYQGWAEHAPFDKVIVTCSPESVPQPLVDQLAEGGKMIIPLGERYQQVFHLLEKRGGKMVATKLIPTLFVPMTGKSEEIRQRLPDPLDPKIMNPGFELDANDDGLPDSWHYQRQTQLMTEGAPHGSRYLRIENSDAGRLAQGLQGMAIDGSKIGSLQLSIAYRTRDVRPGKEPLERPALMVHFYDETRRNMADETLLLVDSSEWTRSSKTIPVPAKTREAIVRVSLNGATGELDLDDVQLQVKFRTSP